MPSRYFNLNLAGWRRAMERHEAESTSFVASARYAVLGRWLSGLEHLVDTNALLQAGLPRAPIFIVGHWRSGTTLLHELLCSAPGTAFPTTYACMNPLSFLLGGSGKQLGSATRPMDNTLVRNDLPQEDEFALFALGAPSPYEAFLFPEGVADIVSRSAPAAWSREEEEVWKRTLLLLLSAFNKKAPSDLHIFKSPSHSLRVDLIRSLIPDSRFIRIVRNPHEVLASSVKMWQSMWRLYAVGAQPDTGVIVDNVCSSMLAVDEAMEASFGRVAAPHATVRFEDLVRKPAEIVVEIAEQLGAPQFQGPPERVQERVVQMAQYARRPLQISPELLAAAKSRLNALCEKWGYRNVGRVATQ